MVLISYSSFREQYPIPLRFEWHCLDEMAQKTLLLMMILIYHGWIVSRVNNCAVCCGVSKVKVKVWTTTDSDTAIVIPATYYLDRQ
eukprot:scaffold75773_cov57-Attheya_sp.AAC.2